MDFSPAILVALQEKLDIGQAFPIVYSMTQQTIEQFVPSVINKLHVRIRDSMQEKGEGYIASNDALGLSLLLMKSGVKLPPIMLMEICQDIIKKSRATAKWIYSVPGQQGDLWYCKLYLDMSQPENAEKE